MVAMVSSSDVVRGHFEDVPSWPAPSLESLPGATTHSPRPRYSASLAQTSKKPCCPATGNRTRNTGAADWMATVGRLVVAYNHPDNNDALTARIVTLWRRA